MSRFAIREATVADADGIARAQTASWRSSYRGLLPDHVLARLDFQSRSRSRRQQLADRDTYTLVAYDVTHRDILGFCDAGPARRAIAGVTASRAGEIYAIYLEHHAKRHGLGREMVELVVARLRAVGMSSLVIWVLDNNVHAHRFYAALGGRPGPRVRSRFDGHPVVEVAYVWPELPPW